LSRGRVGGGGSDRTAFAVKASCHTPLGALEPPDSLIERCFRDDTTTVDQIGVIRRSPPPTRRHRISSWRLSILIFCALLRTEYFTRRWYSVLLGVMLALGRLTKLQCLTALLIPLVVIAIVSLRGTRPRGVLTDETAGRNRTPTVVNIGLAAVTAVGLPVLWYAPNWGPVWSYMQATFFNSPSAAIADPYKVKVLLSFLLNYFDTGNGLEIVLLGALAGGIVVAEHHGHLRRMVRALNDVPEFFALCAFAASPFSRLPSPTKRRSATPSREWWVPPFWWRQRSARYGRSCHAACSVLSSSSTASPAWPGLSSPVFMSPPFRPQCPRRGGLRTSRTTVRCRSGQGRLHVAPVSGSHGDDGTFGTNAIRCPGRNPSGWFDGESEHAVLLQLDERHESHLYHAGRSFPGPIARSARGHFPVCHPPERPLLAGGAVLGAGGTEGNNTSAESRLETKDLAGCTLVGRISGGNDAYQLRWLCLYVKTDSPRIRHSFTIPGGDRH
jgi:hypothetical protein